MKSFVKMSVLSLFVSSLFATVASAGWVVINENGSSTPYTADCCKKRVVKKAPAPAPKACLTCDYSKFPMAKLMPLSKGDKLAPATLKNCGMK